jgi:hypothetical protein
MFLVRQQSGSDLRGCFIAILLHNRRRSRFDGACASKRSQRYWATFVS